MKNLFQSSLKCFASLSLIVFLSAFLGFPAMAESNKSASCDVKEEPRVLRVAFPETKGLTETAEDGTHYGLVVDYLNEIAKYTGWKYDYISVEDIDVMFDDFIAGKYDLLGGQFYVASLEDCYGYPKYNTGYSRSTILARRDDRSVRSNNLESMNGKTIGVYANAKENIRRLKEFLSINNLDCTLREYTYDEFQVYGNLYPYLQNGDVDLMLGNSLDFDESLRVVATFNAQPFFIVTQPDNQEVLDGLNMSLQFISDSNPYFGEEHYNINFPNQVINIQLTDEELQYIQDKGVVTIALPGSWHPLFCLNSSDDLHNGILPDILEEISSFTGLKFEYIFTETYLDALHLVQEGGADLLGFYLGTEEDSIKQNLALSSSYVNINNIIVRNKSTSYPDEGLTCAVLEGRTLPGSIHAAEVKLSNNLAEALAAVNSGEIDFIYGMSPRLEQEIQQHRFSNLVPVSLINENTDICFAMQRPANPYLLTILNKALNNLSAEQKDSILNQNIVSIGARQFSLVEMIYANPMAFVGIVTVILLILVAAILLITHARMKTAVIQSNLAKAEAESRAKGDFLSRMSHEIRTPMNAIIGLTDLTCMIENLPENIRENLFKIRSSSQYLLNLINDILDMSRIERGMLSIASEPFSLTQTLNNVKNMLESEAARRGISFSVETKITHSSLSGDSIRLHQVLMNLLSNAFKFTPEGGSVLLLVLETDSTEENATFTFQVIDNGIGIREEDQQRIFGSFEQVGTSSSQSQGTGLGLSISRNIVTLMGGSLNLKSSPGKGSNFYFTITIPLCEMKSQTMPTTNEGLLDNIHILLAEDNNLNAEIAVQLLEMQGAAVHWVQNGKLALEEFAQSSPDEYQLILMDIQMPVMNGLEAAVAIRALSHPAAASIPIIAMTASSFQKDVDAALEAGMTGFISKPLDVKLLFHTVENILNINQPSASEET